MSQPTGFNTNPVQSVSVHTDANRPSGTASISLMFLFQILTACCIFFAVLRVSPFLAIVGTIIATPAIIRTAVAAEVYQRHHARFGWHRRIRIFVGSVGLTLITLTLAVTVFMLVSLAFGLFCVLATLVLGPTELASEIAIVGTAGGMVWGAAGGIVAMGLSAKYWKPKLEL